MKVKQIMSDIAEYRRERLSSPNDTRYEYRGSGKDARIGIEVEYQFTSLDQFGRDIPMTINQNEQLGKHCASLGTDISQEATSQTIEIKTDAYRPHEISKLTAEFNKHLGALSQVASTLDLTRHDRAILSDVSFDQLLEELNPRERAQIFFNHFLNHGRDEVAQYFARVSGTQISLSYHDEDHGYALYRRLVLLAPLLASLYQNLPSQVTDGQGQLHDVTDNLSLKFRHAAYGISRSVPEALWHQHDDAQDFFDSVNEELWRQDLFCYYDEKGQLHGIKSPSDITSFEALPEHLRTVGNFQLLSSIQWHLVGFSHLPEDENGQQKRRIEFRAFDTLPKDKVEEVVKLLAHMAFDDDFAVRCDNFLQDIGFDVSALDNSRPLWLGSLRDAVKYNAVHAKDHPEDYRALRFGNAKLSDAMNGFKSLAYPILKK